MTKTPLFPITLFLPILIFLIISGCGHSGPNPADTNQPPTIISIVVTPASRSIPLGGTRQFGVTGTYSDGSQSGGSQEPHISASSVTWSSSNTGVMSINWGGLATPITQGTTTISATYGGISVSIALTVTPNDIFTIWSTNVKPVNPVGIAVDSSGNVYIADAAVFSNNSSMIREYSSQGIQLASWATTLTSNVVGVAVNSTSGNVYVTDYDKNLLNIYSTLGTPPTTLAPIAENAAPVGVAVDPLGNIYVTDAKNNYLYKFNSSNVLIPTWPMSTIGVPSGVAVDSSGNVYVADFSNRMIRRYGSDGKQTAWSTTGTPSGVAVDSSGNVYVVDTYYYVLREYDSNGKASQNGPWSTTGWPNAVAVDPSGNVYVVDTTNNIVRKYTP